MDENQYPKNLIAVDRMVLEKTGPVLDTSPCFVKKEGDLELGDHSSERCEELAE